jgi:UDP-GlcNAc:undecaprenyl-phosphate GlcNAc-1-phosphate transferase
MMQNVDARFALPVTAFALSVLLTALARRLAPAIGFIDRPDGGRKNHLQAMPVLGGVAFFSSMLVVFGLSLLLPWTWLTDPACRRMVTSLMSSGFCFCVLGAIDDRWPLRPRTKLLGQVLCCLPFALLGRSIPSLYFLGISVDLGWFAIPFSVLWLTVCSNIVNLLDGLDGLAATIGTVVMLTVASLFVAAGEIQHVLAALILAGSLGGFLVHNWPPARIFMGDAGSLTTGFLAGAIAIEASSKTAAGFTLAVPLVLMSIPLFDTTMAVVRRKLTGRGIGVGDRGHIHHRLQDRGLTRPQALLAIAGLSVLMATAATLSAVLQSETVGLAICLSTLAILVIGRVFGYHETVLFFRYLQELGVLLLDTSGVLRTRFLVARLGHSDPLHREDVWPLVVDRVVRMGGDTLRFQCRDASGQLVGDDYNWTCASPEKDGDARWGFQFSLRREDGSRATLAAEGLALANSGGPRVDDLHRLFAHACQELVTGSKSRHSDPEHSVRPDLMPAVSMISRRAA